MASTWIFAYGSLMWRPGFTFEEERPALLRGAHRALCIYSHVHRGTPERPGLVLGLDRGGACRGAAFRVESARWDETLRYLRAREQATAVYLEVRRTVTTWVDGRPERVEALFYVTDRTHRQYAGRLSIDEQIRFVLQGTGQAGPNEDYIVSTVEHLRGQGIRDHGLESLLAGLMQAKRKNALIEGRPEHSADGRRPMATVEAGDSKSLVAADPGSGRRSRRPA